jgi:hypothetical protein
MEWISIKEKVPQKDGTYLTYIKNKKYDSVGFTQFIDSQFMSSFVTHWMNVPAKPNENTESKADLIYKAIGEGYGFNGSKVEAIHLINLILNPCCDSPNPVTKFGEEECNNCGIAL